MGDARQKEEGQGGEAALAHGAYQMIQGKACLRGDLDVVNRK